MSSGAQRCPVSRVEGERRMAGEAGRRGVSWAVVLTLALAAPAALAVDPPHDATRSPTQLCQDCHQTHSALGTALQRDAVACLGCHDSQALPPRSQWSGLDQAVPGVSGTSHRWDTPDPVNPAFGATLPADPAMAQRAVKGLSCSVCHDPHSKANPRFEPGASGASHFLRYPNRDGGICLQCHGSWALSSASTWTGAVQSHPVGVGLPAGDLTFFGRPQDVGGGDQIDSAATSTGATGLGDWTRAFGAPDALKDWWAYFPRLDAWRQVRTSGAQTIGWDGPLAIADGERYLLGRARNLSARLPLVSGGQANLAAGQVTCMTCHGVHYADSDTATVDDAPRAGDGRLLRRNLASGGGGGSTAPSRDEACTGCHDVKGHAGDAILANGSRHVFSFGCLDCHATHGSRNIMLVREALSPTAGSTTSGVDLRTLTASPASGPDFSSGVAKATGGVGPQDLANSLSPGRGPCEACHTLTGDLAASGPGPRFRSDGSGANGRHFQNQCLACHPHRGGFKGREPNGGSEPYGQPCYPCHSYGMRTADDAALRRSTYHHVMEGDGVAGPTSAAPTVAADGDKRCVQCHVDHPFGPTRAANLRTAVGVEVPASADFSAAAPGGVCLSCHATDQEKNTTDQKSDGTSATPAISAADFAASAHRYPTEPTGSMFRAGGGTFSVACVKCHSDGQPTATQDGQARVSLHASPDRRLRNPLGMTQFTRGGDALEESFCYRCHSASTDASPGGGPPKTITNTDVFGAFSGMTPGSTGLFAQMQRGTANGPNGPTTTTTRLYLQPAGAEDPVAPPAASPDSATYGTDTLFLKNGVEEMPAEPIPGAYFLNSGAYDTTEFRPRVMSPAQGSTAEVQIQSWGNRYLRQGQFSSPPFASRTAYKAGAPIGFYFYGAQNNHNCYLQWAMYKWNANDTPGGQVVPTTMGTFDLEPRWYVNPNGTPISFAGDVTFEPGDKLVLEVEIKQPWDCGWCACGGVWGAPGNLSRIVLPPRPDGNLPEFSYQGPPTAGGARVARSMSPFPPPGTPNEVREAASATVPAGTRLWQRSTFVSPPLATPTITAAAPWTLNLFDRQSDALASARVRYKIYPLKADATRGPDIVPWSTWASPLPTVTAQQVITTAPGAPVALAAGDRLVVDVQVQTLNVVTGGAYGLEVIYGPSRLSNLVMPAAATFSYDNRGTPSVGRHDVAFYSGVHRPHGNDESPAYLAANRHVECEDCHSPHGAQAGRHTKGSNAAGPALRGAPAVAPTFSAPNWDVATPVTYARTTVTAGTPEAYVCFRCHSSYNPAIPDDPVGLPSPPWSQGGGGFTNTAREFSPSNRSGHPVLASLNAYPNSTAPRTLTAAQLVGTDRTWTPGQTMTCSDCHNADASNPVTQGPHASAVRYMLTGTNRAWPYTVAGATSGTLFALGTNNEAGAGTANGLFCRNCHPRQHWPGGGTNQMHYFFGEGHGNQGTCPNGCRECVRCHIRVPHGGKVSRLIATTDAPARYTVPGYEPFLSGFAKAASPTFYECDFTTDKFGCGTHCYNVQVDTW